MGPQAQGNERPPCRAAEPPPRSFHERLGAEHAAFVAVVEGPQPAAEVQGYASLVFLRLMFLSFLQAKGVLDGDLDYLRQRLNRQRRQSGQHTFFRPFLLRLLHERLSQPPDQRAPRCVELFGDVPFLGAGCFAPPEWDYHHLELQMPDSAFERLLDFFAGYHWHLDDGPPHCPGDLTPKDLGILAERLLHRKQFGGYYTGNDVTGYIARGTLLPFLLEATARQCPAAFQRNGPVWGLLAQHPERYLHAAICKGVLDARGHTLPPPAEVAAGLDDWGQRDGWDRPAREEVALPGETWRDVVARRRHCLELYERLRRGEAQGVNDLITWNLDLLRFTRDVVSHADPELRRVFRGELQRVAVLDPTCGPGAFLFAALDVLEPLHLACGECRLFDVRRFILSHNLHGVDLMPEAAEVCRLRLLLKLLAAADRVEDLAALPDLGHTIRAGNALVGYVTAPESHELKEVEPPDRRLAREYRCESEASFEAWHCSHRPFHWFIEFPEILHRGGFDVVLGNPPYVEYRLVRDRYTLPPGYYETEPADNLYAFCLERAGKLTSPHGRCGMIVPAGLLSLDEAASLRRTVLRRFPLHWFSTYAIRPAQLFDGVDQRLCIDLAASSPDKAPVLHTTRYQHWNAQERGHLFALLRFQRSFVYPALDRIPQLGSDRATGAFARLARHRDHLLSALYAAGRGGFLLHYHRSPRYWVRGMDFEPYFRSPTRQRSVHHFRDLHFRSEREGKAAGAILNSSLFFFWFLAIGNGRNLTAADVAFFPVGGLDEKVCDDLGRLFDLLMRDYRANSVLRERRRCAYQEFRPGRSKPLLDAIDRVLARHYGFDDEELDWIQHYEIKYRLGLDGREE
jgi:hypothetical protein